MEKITSVIKAISRRLYFGLIYSCPTICVSMFLWVAGYDLPELKHLLIVMAILFFLLGSATPLKVFETSRNDRQIDLSGLTAAEATMISELVDSMTAKNKRLEEFR